MAQYHFSQHPGYFRGPVEVWFAGFRSDSYTLQKNGWEFVQTMDAYERTLHCLFRNKEYGLTASTDRFRFDIDQLRGIGESGRGVRLNVNRIASSDRVIFQTPAGPKDYSAVDCTPTWAMVEEAYGLNAFFGGPPEKTVEVLVEPSSVEECLALIQRMQSPKLAEIREQNRVRDNQIAYKQHFQAKLLSMA